jgi:hypothetical protein
LASVCLEEVAALLGHSDTRITEKHYSLWVGARQEKLERTVAKAWDAAVISTTPDAHNARSVQRLGNQ